MRDGLIDSLDIVGQAAHQFPGGVLVEKLDRERLQMDEQVTAQTFERILRDTRHHPTGDSLETIIEQKDNQQQNGYACQPGSLLGADKIVDSDTDQVGFQ